MPRVQPALFYIGITATLALIIQGRIYDLLISEAVDVAKTGHFAN